MVEPVPENLKWSLKVPSLQELMKDPKLDEVPPRYLWDGNCVDADVKASDPHRELEVPRIDMAKLMEEDYEGSQRAELLRLRSACKDWGTFQLINHGVSIGALKEMKETVNEFFELPPEEKTRCEQKPGSLEGYGHAFVKSGEQKLDWSDILFLKALPTNSRSYHLWPENPPNFRRALEAYSEEMRELALRIVKFMLKGLSHGVDDHDNHGEDHNKVLCESMRQGRYEVRMNYYPPCPQPERVIGISPHIDISVVTLLVECGDVPGLQLLKDGRWVFVPPVDGAILVNLGAIMQIFSNGIYKAPDHRAVVSKDRERISMVTFCYPDPALDIGPSKQITGGSARMPPIYRTLTHSDYFNAFFNLERADAPFLDGLRI